jgi:hypothetical protein
MIKYNPATLKEKFPSQKGTNSTPALTCAIKTENLEEKTAFEIKPV